MKDLGGTRKGLTRRDLIGTLVGSTIGGGAIGLSLFPSPEARRLSVSHATASTFLADDSGLAIARHYGASEIIENWSCDEDTRVIRSEVFSSTVRSIAASPDGAHTAVACNDGSIKVFDQSSLRLTCELSNHSARARCVVFAHDGSLLGTAGEDGAIFVFSARSWRLVGTHRAWPSFFSSLSFSRDDRLLVASGECPTGLLWNIKDNEFQTLPGPEGAALKYVSFSPVNDSFVSCTANGSLTMWKPHAGKFKPLGRLRDTAGFRMVRHSAGGKWVYCAGYRGEFRIVNPDLQSVEHNILPDASVSMALDLACSRTHPRAVLTREDGVWLIDPRIVAK